MEKSKHLVSLQQLLAKMLEKYETKRDQLPSSELRQGVREIRAAVQHFDPEQGPELLSKKYAHI